MNRAFRSGVILAAALLVGGVAHAAPQTIRVHGYLADQSAGPNGAPADGLFSMSFAVYDSANGGAPLASHGPVVVEVTQGRYDVALPLSPAIFDGQPRWLEVTVEGQALVPRLELTSVPYAFDSDTVGGIPADQLEESQEIDDKIAVHAAQESAEIDDRIAAQAAIQTADTQDRIEAHRADPGAHPTYVKRAGDTMVGPLTIAPLTGPALRIGYSPGGGIEFALPAGTASTHLGWSTQRQALAFDGNVAIDEAKRIEWPTVSGPYAGGATFSISKLASDPAGQDQHPDGEQDETWQLCFNCNGAATQRQDARQHAWNQKVEANYFDGQAEYIEVNWNYTAVDGVRTRPFGFAQQMTPTCVDPGGALDGQSCIAASGRDACEAAGGSCLLDGAGMFDWTPSPYGLCSEDRDRLCKLGFDGQSTECSGTCERPFDLQVSQRGGVVQSGTGLEIITTQPGPLRYVRPASFYSPLRSLQTISPRQSGLSFQALQASQTFGDGAVDGAAIVDWFGTQSNQRFTGANAAGRTVERWIANDSVQLVDQTAPGASIDTTLGYRWLFKPQGEDVAFGEVAGLSIAGPEPGGAGLSSQTIAALRGVRVGDLQGLGDETDAVLVDAQSDGTGAKGNLRLAGGGAFDGHLALGTGSLWWDEATSSFRVKDGDPTDDGDGTPVHAPPGMNASWGEVLWGAAGSASPTAEAVCAAASLSCARGFDPVAGADRDCNSASWQGGYFMAFCN